jgi:hypothetical protein
MNKIVAWVVTGGAVLVIVVAGGGYVLTKDPVNVVPSTTNPLTTSTTAGTQSEGAQIEFVKIIEGKLGDINKNELPELRGVWSVQGKLAYIRNDVSTNENVLYFDGKEVFRTKSLLKGAGGITDKLAYYTVGGERKFYFGDQVYTGLSFSSAPQSVGGKLVFNDDMKGLFYDGKIVEQKDKNTQIYGITDIGGKLAYIKRSLISPYAVQLIFDSKVIPLPNHQLGTPDETIGNYNGEPAYTTTEATSSGQTKYFVEAGGKAVSNKYDHPISHVSVIGGKVAFRTRIQNATSWGGNVLVWGDKVLGNNYDDVIDYFDDNGTPIFLALNYPRDEMGKISNTWGRQYFIVKGDQVINQGEKGETWEQEASSVVVNGKLASWIGTEDQSGSDNHSYLYYGGTKYFKDLRIQKLFDLGGKLAVYAHDDNSQYIYLEK